MWAPNGMAAQPNIGGALLKMTRSEVPLFHSLHHAAKFVSRPLLERRAVTLPI